VDGSEKKRYNFSFLVMEEILICTCDINVDFGIFIGKNIAYPPFTN